MADTDRTVDSVAKLTSDSGVFASNMERAEKAAAKLKQDLAGAANTTPNFGSSSQGNTSSSSTPTSVGGGFGGAGGGGFGSGQTPYSSPMPSSGSSYGRSLFNLSNLGKVAKSLVQGASGMALAIGDVLPTSQEALYSDMYTQRLGFYGGSSLTGSESIAQQMNAMGTSTDPMDAIKAAGSGAALGLLPGLSNFNTGNFGGITGGAALLSNLVPGMGLQSGMMGMAALNQAGSVNRLRMLGINVRNAAGTSMADLPTIVEQLYGMMKQSAGGDFSVQDIAVSAMSGNALDSILKQYFPDPNLRQGILAGLVQRTRTDTNLGVSGTQQALADKGGTTEAAAGISLRNAAEYQMISGLSAETLAGMNQGNLRLRELYGGLGSAKGLFGSTVGGIAQLKTGLETVSGGRGGAVGGAFDTLSNSLSAIPGLGAVTDFLMPLLQLGISASASSKVVPSNQGTTPITITNNITLPSGTTYADAQSLGMAIGNQINAQTLAQLAAART